MELYLIYYLGINFKIMAHLIYSFSSSQIITSSSFLLFKQKRYENFFNLKRIITI